MLMLFIFSFLSGFTVFCMKHKHFLLTLLSLEYMVISLYMIITVFTLTSYTYFSLVFISFSACEGALGLSILVSISRSFGSDMISLFSFV